MQQVGGSLGLSVLVTVFGTVSRHHHGDPFIHGATAAFTMAAVFTALALVLVLSLKPPARPGPALSAAPAVPGTTGARGVGAATGATGVPHSRTPVRLDSHQRDRRRTSLGAYGAQGVPLAVSP